MRQVLFVEFVVGVHQRRGRGPIAIGEKLGGLLEVSDSGAATGDPRLPPPIAPDLRYPKLPVPFQNLVCEAVEGKIVLLAGKAFSQDRLDHLHLQ
jgi:hypothetical protein